MKNFVFAGTKFRNNIIGYRNCVPKKIMTVYKFSNDAVLGHANFDRFKKKKCAKKNKNCLKALIHKEKMTGTQFLLVVCQVCQK